MVKIQIKWNNEKFDVNLNTEGPLLELKNQIEQITKVPIDKQKLIFKGTVLNDDHVLAKLNIKEKAIIMLMGQAEENLILKEPQQKTVFIEDLTPEEKAKILKEKAGIIVPAGLTNLGNTCYLNATLQCLKRVDEFKDNIKQYSANGQGPDFMLVQALKQLFIKIETAGDSFTPDMFVETFMNLFPQFYEGYKPGQGFKQQDADEAFQNILQSIEHLMQIEDQEGDKYNLLQKLFEIQYEVRWKNQDLPDEPETVKYETMRKQLCIIDNQAKPIEHLSEGIEASLVGQIEKLSELDNKNHIYLKQSRINKLPNYMLVQMVRFFWKQQSVSSGTQATKAKILKNVSFPKILDVFPFCSEELQKQLQLGKDYEKKQQDDELKQNENKFDNYKKKLEQEGQMIPEDTRELYKKFKEAQQEEEVKLHDDRLYGKRGLGLDTGNYELIAVLSHKGRTADSGHYVAWIHNSGDDWFKYDDDIVSVVKTEEILNLRGGGDWHMAYYLIYRKLEVI